MRKLLFLLVTALLMSALMAGTQRGKPVIVQAAEVPAEPDDGAADAPPAHSRFAKVVYVYGDWRLTEMYDCMPPHNFRREQSHVRIEYKGETVYLKQGLGCCLWFADAEDFTVHGCNGQAPARTGIPVWQDALGRPTDLEVECLTGNGNITLALLDAGERYVWRKIRFLELATDGKPDEQRRIVRELLECETCLDLPSAERVNGDVWFKLPDGGWFGWDTLWLAPKPVATVSLRGGPHTRNGPLSEESKAELERGVAGLDPENKWAPFIVRDTILEYLYHGHVDEARAVLKRHIGWLSHDDAPAEDANARVNWFWKSMVGRFCDSPLGRLLEDEFPQLSNESLRAAK